MVNTMNNFSLEEFEAALQKENLVLVDFFASWCGPCKMLAPIIEQVTKKYQDKITVVKLDVDEHQDIAGKYGIQSVPTLMLFKHGSIAERSIGVLNLNQCSELIDKHLK